MHRSKFPINYEFQSRYAPRWTNEQIRRFIKTRIKYESLFGDRLYYSTQDVWEKIAFESGIPESWRRLKKKWSNLIYKYRKICYAPSKPLLEVQPITWPFFELIHNYESYRIKKNSNSWTSKDDDINKEEYQFMDTTNYIIEEHPCEIRTYKRVPGTKLTKSPESTQPILNNPAGLTQPLIRIDKSIFKDEPLDLDPDPITIKIEDDSDTEVYELMPSPKQDDPSDTVEYESNDEIQNDTSFSLLSPQSISPEPIIENPSATQQTNVSATASHAQTSLKSEKLSMHDEPKKRKNSKLDDGESMGEKKLRREFMKCTNVFLKFMKMKYNIEPDPISSDDDTD